ncbi:MAG: hypothetical protein U0871_22375 [Gemmataceae bacterium]
MYPYLYGSTTLAMLTLPPELNAGGVDATLERLRTPAVRHELEAAFANPRFPIETIRLANLPCDEFRHLEGRGLVEAAEGRPLVKFVCDLLLATDLAAGCVIRHFAERQESDIVALTRHPAITAGSDGIFSAASPTPAAPARSPSTSASSCGVGYGRWKRRLRISVTAPPAGSGCGTGGC